VSYSRADWRHAADIDAVLRAKGLKSFFDRRNLAPGLRWVPALEHAIGAAKAAMVLIGPHVGPLCANLTLWNSLSPSPAGTRAAVALPQRNILGSALSIIRSRVDWRHQPRASFLTQV
jgi:hypothetical protein